LGWTLARIEILSERPVLCFKGGATSGQNAKASRNAVTFVTAAVAGAIEPRSAMRLQDAYAKKGDERLIIELGADLVSPLNLKESGKRAEQ